MTTDRASERYAPGWQIAHALVYGEEEERRAARKKLKDEMYANREWPCGKPGAYADEHTSEYEAMSCDDRIHQFLKAASFGRVRLPKTLPNDQFQDWWSAAVGQIHNGGPGSQAAEGIYRAAFAPYVE